MKNPIITMFVATFIAILINACGNDLAYQGDSSNDDNSVNDSYNDNSVNGSASPSPRPSGIPGVNPSCVGVPTLTESGLLWKPISESDGNLVVIFPPSFSVQFESVRAVDLGGQEEEGEFSAFANGDRQHWRFSKPGSEYSGIVLVTNGLEECSLQVPNPAERYEIN